MLIFANNPGFDYSHGLPMENGEVPNIDPNTGIRYGIIPHHKVLQAWADESEPEYPCEECEFWNKEDEECTDIGPCCEPIAYNFENDEYLATQDSQGDIFVIRSPFYTYAQFCSPCAPGACYLTNPVSSEHENNKCYCLGEDWFEEDFEPCPYPIWRVDTDELVYEPKGD